MKIIASDGVKVYDVTSGKSLPQWLSESKKAALRKNDDYQRRLDLLQDFSFPAACQRIKVTPDQNYIFATGYHPPMLKVYDLNNLGLKFDRHLQSEVVDFQILTEDYSKAAFLCADRTISLHARFGTYYTTRVPRYGRDLAYAPFAAELLVSGSSPEVFRISLEEGRFMQPLMSRLPAINASGVSPVHGLFGCAGEGGGLECFDLRQRSSAGFLDAAAACGAPGEDLTAIRYDESGLYVAVGTSNGLVGLFDLRSQKPVVIKDHMYGSKIVDIKFHNGGGQGALGGKRVVSSDTRIVKIWEQSSGLNYTSIEPVDSGDINDICVWPDSGLIMVGLDSSKVQGFFIPSLGPAPRWCHHLEGLTEELEERAPTVYDDFRFVTKEDLSKLGLDHLLGTPMLRAYMHGFFVDNRLYEKAKILTDPFAYETYRQQRVQKKLEEERQSRISLVRKLPKVNAKVAAKLMAQEQADADEMGKGEGERLSKRKGEASVTNPLSDDRFKAMFEEDDFVVDEESAEFKMQHPNLPTTGPNKKNAGAREAEPLVSEHFDAVSEEEEESDDSLDDMEEAPARHRPPVRKDKKLKTGPSKNLGISKGGVEKTMYAAKDAASVEAFRRAVGSNGLGSSHLTLSERAAAQSYQRPRSRVGGSREISFAARSSGRGDRGGGGMRGRGGGGRGRGRGGRGDGGSDGPSERGGGGGDRGRGRGRSSGGRGRGPGGSGRGRGPSRGGSRGGGGGRGRGRR